MDTHPPQAPILTNVSVAALQPLIFVLRERHIDPEPLLKNVGMSLAELDDPNHRVSTEQYYSIWHQAISFSNDAALGVHVGLKSEPSAFGPVGYVMANARDCKSAFLLWNHFSRLILDVPLFQMQRDGDVAIISLARTTTASPDLIRPITEFVMFSLLRVAVFITNITPSEHSGLLGLEFRHSAPPAEIIHEYEMAAITSNISFSADANRILFSADFLDKPTAYSDPAILEIMLRRSDEMLRALAIENDLVTRVKSAIRRRLGGTAPTLVMIAQDCNMSRATLQRKLTSVSSGYQKLLDEVRYNVAREYLDSDDASVDELSYLLGYSETSAFHHAFKRWTGIGTVEYKMRQQRHRTP